MLQKWMLFDAMGVIFRVGDDTNELLVPYVQKINLNCSKEEINHLSMQASLGEMTAQKFWELSCAADAAAWMACLQPEAFRMSSRSPKASDKIRVRQIKEINTTSSPISHLHTWESSGL